MAEGARLSQLGGRTTVDLQPSAESAITWPDAVPDAGPRIPISWAAAPVRVGIRAAPGYLLSHAWNNSFISSRLSLHHRQSLRRACSMFWGAPGRCGPRATPDSTCVVTSGRADLREGLYAVWRDNVAMASAVEPSRTNRNACGSRGVPRTIPCWPMSTTWPRQTVVNGCPCTNRA